MTFGFEIQDINDIGVTVVKIDLKAVGRRIGPPEPARESKIMTMPCH